MSGFLRSVFSPIAAFFRWWLSELAALIPPPLRRFFRQGGERLLLETDDGEAKLYRLRGNRAELLATDVGKKTANSKPQEVTLALPSKQLVTRETDLPLAAEENLREVLGFEMDRLTPFSRTEVYYDFRVLERDPKRGRLHLEVLLSPRKTVDTLISQAEQRGFHTKAVDVCTKEAGGASGRTLGINLLPPPATAVPSKYGRIAATALTATAVLLMFLAVEIPLQRKADYAEALNQRIAAERSRITALRKLEAEIASLASVDADPGNLKSAENLTLALIDRITRLLPDDTWLTQMSLAGDRLELAGFSPASSKLLTTFEQSPLFTETVFRAPVTQDPRLGLERFSLSLRVLPRQEEP